MKYYYGYSGTSGPAIIFLIRVISTLQRFISKNAPNTIREVFFVLFIIREVHPMKS